jgi:hypothetical protein
MSTEGEQPTRAELIAKAGELRTSEGLSTRAVASRMGIPHSTARDYIRIAEQHGEWVDLFSRAEMSQALGLQGMEILGRVKGAIDETEEPAELARLAPIWFKGAGQLAQLFGLNAPTRVQTEDVTDRGRANMDPEIVAAVREAQRRAARERAEIRGTEPPDDEENEA